MKRRLLVMLFVGLLPAVALCQAARENSATGQISGRVLDADGKPVKGASVCANSRPAGIGGICTDSRADGKFTIHLLKPGFEYVLFAAKKQDYYPYPTTDFYDALPGNRVTVKLEEGRALENVEVLVGPKAGRLVGTVTNADTGAVVERFGVLACRDARPEDCIGAGAEGNPKNGRFNILVPTAAFRIKVSAPGFEDWYGIEGPKDRAVAMLVASGNTMELNIFLRPISRGN